MTEIKSITFTSNQYRLHGYLHLPNTVNPPLVIGSHGLLANADSPKQIALANRCIQSGIAFMRFDHRGCGKSQGNFEKVTSLEGRCTDLICAIEAGLNLVNSDYPIGLFGSSMGGAVCVAVAGKMPATGPKVVVAAPIKTRDVNPANQIQNSKKPDLPDSFYIEHLLFDIEQIAHKIDNILIFHGDMDKVVPVSNAYQLHCAAKNPKKLIIQKNGDHGMSNKIHQQEFQNQAIKWFCSGFGLEGAT